MFVIKKLHVAVVIVFFAVSCKDQKEAGHAETEKVIPAGIHQPDTKEAGLALNNGTKWKADSSTNKNVRSLLQITEDFSALPVKSMTAYSTVAVELQTGLDTMITECRMQGADHDALHKWLEPLIGQVIKLKGSADLDEAAHLFDEISKQVKLYVHYFE